MEQIKALNALEPFVVLSKAATSPRAAAELVTRATSAPNTFVFAELIQTPQIQALANSPEHAPQLALLRIFSHGTYASYKSHASLPPLNDAQEQKLRKLSLLTLARDCKELSYQQLQDSLALDSARLVEGVVISCIYDGLLDATLDPQQQVVHVTSISPLRDVEPGAVPDMITALDEWADRCSSTIADIEAQINSIRSVAAQRSRSAVAANDKLEKLMAEVRESEPLRTDQVNTQALARRGLNKRAILESEPVDHEDKMDLDDPSFLDEQSKRASKRKI
ncbi:hypothetical protein CDD81_4486 [Ophiocordyceps australis]|uniref:PCI domain-containing protein n=1 Tax=Ophiocordyceps australis TaxID=1399860 RepID=A0A2C5YJK0_9HYPO|nr:hypothetical protein CDD81_4486 [Ophiocordyceps australis]